MKTSEELYHAWTSRRIMSLSLGSRMLLVVLQPC